LPYIGNTPAEKYAAFNVQNFTTSSTTSYTLDRAIANELDIRLVINNVIQQPGIGKAYTASGTTLTLSGATTGTDTMYAVYIGKAIQTVTPGAGSVGTTALQDNSVTNAKLADATQGDVIYYGAAGAPAQLAAGTSGHVLKTQGAGANPIWAADQAGTITAFTNGVDNRVVTATSATALNGESGLIFDGSKLGIGTSTMTRTLNVTDTTSGASTGIQLIGANNGTQFINFGDTDDTNVGEISYDHGLNKMNFRTNDAYAMVIDTAGTVTTPLNPAFRVYQSTQTTYAPNHTMYNQNTTEVYDVNGDYGTLFTAPVTGKYLFTVSFYDVTASDAQTYDMMLTTSNRGYRWGNRNAYKSGYTGYGGNMKGEGTVIVDMDVNDTAYVQCGSSANVVNGSNSEHSYFSGILIG